MPKLTAKQSYYALTSLRRACVNVSRDETLAGCCGAVALMVHAACGGELLKGQVPVSDEDGEHLAEHYWNRLPDGEEIDLTSTQFGGDGWQPITSGVPVEKPELVALEHLLFAADVIQEMERTDRQLTKTAAALAAFGKENG